MQCHTSFVCDGVCAGIFLKSVDTHIQSLLCLDSKVILAIRRAEQLKKLIYVSCNPRAAMNNFVE